MKSHDFKAMLIASHPEHAEAILAEDDRETLDDDYDGSDEPLTVEDIAAMQEITDTLLRDIETQGYALEDM